MKRALVLSLVALFVLGISTFGQMTGTWDANISMDPGATLAGDLFVNLTSSLDINYTLGGWVFGATSGFDRIGWSSMSFDAAGVLGAFSFTGVMNFEPRTITGVVWDYTAILGTPVTLTALLTPYVGCWVGDADYVTYTYGSDFDDMKFVASVSIAGVSLEGLFFLEGWTGNASDAPFAFYWNGSTLVQTDGTTAFYLGAAASATSTGSGFRFKISGSTGGLDITSLTYFSLTEPFVSSTSLSKKGTFTVSGCDLGFTEQYINVDGFMVGCATFEIGLDITCAGFNWIAFRAYDIDLGYWGLLGDFTIKFTEKTKTVSFALDFDLDVVCFEIGTSLQYADFVVDGFSIDSIVLDTEIGGVQVISSTLFSGSYSTVYDAVNQLTFLKPVTGMENTVPVTDVAIPSIDEATGYGYYDAVCVKTEYWDVWETFEIIVDGDSCCGGAFEFAVETGMGTKYELDNYAWNYQFDNDGDAPTHWAEYLYSAIETGDTVYAVGSLGGILGNDANGDGVVDVIDYTLVSGAVAAEQLLTGTVYEAASSDSLFAWVYTNVDLSVDLSTSWALLFGAEIDVYGWNELSFGFEFEF